MKRFASVFGGVGGHSAHPHVAVARKEKLGNKKLPNSGLGNQQFRNN